MNWLKKPRTRDKLYLIYVRSHRCLVCQRPADAAHHIMYAQPRAKSMKVGDEWVVPLCALHHEEIHAYGNERLYWSVVGINPLEWAERCYAEWRMHD